MPTTHELKTINPYFDDVWDGRKRFELRKDDRNFQVGEWLQLREYGENGYTGRNIMAVIDYKLDGGVFGLAEGYCILGIDKLVHHL